MFLAPPPLLILFSKRRVIQPLEVSNSSVRSNFLGDKKSLTNAYTHNLSPVHYMGSPILLRISIHLSQSFLHSPSLLGLLDRLSRAECTLWRPTSAFRTIRGRIFEYILHIDASLRVNGNWSVWRWFKVQTGERMATVGSNFSTPKRKIKHV
jgi:hypothetical protein